MPSNRTKIFVTLGIALVSGLYWITYARPVVFCALLQEDGIEAAFCGTYDKLKNYKEHPEEARDWLLAYHGEAPSHQVMLTLLSWAYENQDDFIDLLSRIGDEDADHFILRFAFAIWDSGQSDHYQRAFGARKLESERLHRILVRVTDIERNSTGPE